MAYAHIDRCRHIDVDVDVAVSKGWGSFDRVQSFLWVSL